MGKKEKNVMKSNQQKKLKIKPLNPMLFHPRFPHITEKIFKNLGINGLKNCREVSKLWQNCIDDQNILWKELVKSKGVNRAFQLACEKGHSKMANMLIQKFDEIKIDFHSKNENDMTAFHFACKNGLLKVVEMMIRKSNELDIDLNAKNWDGRTGFQFACEKGHSKIVEILVQKSDEFNIDLNTKERMALQLFD